MILFMLKTESINITDRHTQGDLFGHFLTIKVCIDLIT